MCKSLRVTNVTSHGTLIKRFKASRSPSGTRNGNKPSWIPKLLVLNPQNPEFQSNEKAEGDALTAEVSQFAKAHGLMLTVKSAD
jgi:hypothetical protein